MLWKSDKIAHYKYCYEHTINAKKGTTFIWGCCVMAGVSFYKEVINDLIMKKGTFDLLDMKANFDGCKDAWNGKESKF